MADSKPKENRNPDASKIVVRKSKVHGTGVFAACDIKKGEKIIEYVGEIITKKEAEKRCEETLAKSNNHETGGVYVFELNDKYDIDGNVDWNPAKFFNHSCEPNCETEGSDTEIWVEAMRDIKKGEELTYDYCYGDDDFESHPCKCGTKSCCGYIVSEKLRDKVRERLRKN